MKPGDLVHLSYPFKNHINLYEGDMIGDDGFRENGHKLCNGETALILKTLNGIKEHTVYHFILAPRNSTGWIHEFHLRAVE